MAEATVRRSRRLQTIATFKKIHCVVPRGQYDLEVFENFFRLGSDKKGFKIEFSQVADILTLPHTDAEVFFVVNTNCPLKFGQTLVLLLNVAEVITVEISLNNANIAKSGPTHEVLGFLLSKCTNKELVTTTDKCFSSFHRTSSGYLYILESGFIFVPKPPVIIHFDTITSVNFIRSSRTTRSSGMSFDFEIKLIWGAIYKFSRINIKQYSELFNFIAAKKLKIKDCGDESSPDEDYLPTRAESEAEDEYDSFLSGITDSDNSSNWI